MLIGLNFRCSFLYQDLLSQVFSSKEDQLLVLFFCLHISHVSLKTVVYITYNLAPYAHVQIVFDKNTLLISLDVKSAKIFKTVKS